MALSKVGLLRKGFQGLKRLAHFFYYAQQSAPSFPATAPRLPITVPTTSRIECDVCIVGSGAGGGVMAAELSAAGLQVVVLEMAAPHQAGDFEQREVWGTEHLFLQHGRLASRDLSMTIVAGSSLGGGTTVNWQTSLRTPDDVREEWARGSGLSFFAEDSFSQSLAAVLRRARVSTDESALNANNDVLRRGCEKLGYACETIPRNAHGCDPEQCGHCVFGCRRGAKQSTTVSFLRDAVETGRTRVLANCRAEFIMQAGGRATGVSARTGPGQTVQVRSRLVVAAGGGIETPLLLMRSGIRLPALGRHLMLHPAMPIAGFYDEPIRSWVGPPQTIVCNEFTHMSGNYGFRLEAAPAHPGLSAFALPWHSAHEHATLMQRFEHAAVLVALTRDHEGGRVWARRSGHTLFDYRLGAREQRYLKEGMIAAARVHEAAGAHHIVQTLSQRCEWRRGEDFEAFVARIRRLPCDRNRAPLFSAHQMGTCRLGARADASVCDGHGQVHGVPGLFIGDASAFPGSSGVNPMITIMALAHHIAQSIRDRV